LETTNRRTRSCFAGCLLGGAVGDALGAPVEFDGIASIRQRYGPPGIVDFDEAHGRRGAITDDTQMTLFTAEGLLRGVTRFEFKGICHPATVVYHAYIRWLHTQSDRSTSQCSADQLDGWLIGVNELHNRRSPGTTCLTALRGGVMGTRESPLNNSKGCGGVMRAAPVGLIAINEGDAFRLGCETAAITHGHPSGYYSAGCLAAIVFYLVAGQPLLDAIELTLGLLEIRVPRQEMPLPPHTPYWVVDKNPDHEECAQAIHRAVALWRRRELPPSPEVVETLGGGWVGEQALAISLYCALAAGDDFERGVRLGVNHSGDSDSTGAITGNILGLMLGVDAIPRRWLDGLELRDEIDALAGDLLTGYENTETWWKRYPGT
jgi:ADP-ribosylglycohydrolase